MDTIEFRRSLMTVSRLDAVIARLRAMLDLLFKWQGRARQRRELMKRSDRLLKDIGISRADARREASKPFWRE